MRLLVTIAVAAVAVILLIGLLKWALGLAWAVVKIALIVAAVLFVAGLVVRAARIAR